MSRPIILQSTLDVLEHALLSVGRYDNSRAWDEYRYYWLRLDEVTPSTVRRWLLFVNRCLAQFEGREPEKIVEGGRSLDWLFYEQQEEVIPVYDEGLGVVSRSLIVAPAEIPNLLAFMGIPGAKSGIDVENHDGKGYHFHYGKIKRDALKRYDVLLTFNKNDVDKDKHPVPDIPLHIEPHATGKCLHIDASTIGHNRRLPVYLVCLKAMNARGLKNFLTPSADSWPFYPAV